MLPHDGTWRDSNTDLGLAIESFLGFQGPDQALSGQARDTPSNSRTGASLAGPAALEARVANSIRRFDQFLHEP